MKLKGSIFKSQWAKKEKKSYWTSTFRFNCSSHMETWRNLGTLLFYALHTARQNPQQVQQLNRHILKLWGGWVCPIQKGKAVSFPNYRWIQSPQDYHEGKTASVPSGGRISYGCQAHIWDKCGKGIQTNAWPTT